MVKDTTIYAGIDPGSVESAIVYYQNGEIIKKFLGLNAAVKELIWANARLEDISYNCKERLG